RRPVGRDHAGLPAPQRQGLRHLGQGDQGRSREARQVGRAARGQETVPQRVRVLVSAICGVTQEGSTMHSINRRDFLHNAALLSAALAGTTSEAAPAVARKDKGNTLRVAVVGVRSRGGAHVDNFANRHGCLVTTICDADSAVIGKAMRAATKAQGREPRFVQDVRKVVEDKDIDIVSIATPNHWHSLMAIWALQNGKDVYVEKPVSHNVSEGRRLVEAARKYGRICQAGTQIRSHKGVRDAIAFLHAGKLGKVQVARGLCYKLRGSIGKVKGPQPIPKTVDYNLWCGPAPDGP